MTDEGQKYADILGAVCVRIDRDGFKHAIAAEIEKDGKLHRAGYYWNRNGTIEECVARLQDWAKSV